MAMRVRRAAAGVAMLATVAAGCAQEAGDDITVGWSTTDPGPDTRTTAERRADEDAARRMLLTADDLPGWRAGPVDDSSDDAIDKAALAECLGVDREEIDADNPSASSATFSTVGNRQAVSAEVTFTRSTAATARSLEIFRSDAAPGCFAEAVMNAFAKQKDEQPSPPGVEFSDPKLERLPVGDLGDGAVSFRISGSVSAFGENHDLYIDTLLVRVGRIGITATFKSEDEPFDSDEAERLTQLMVDRAPEG